MARQARGRARRRKAGLEPIRPPDKPRDPTHEENDERLAKINSKIIDYLENELETFLPTHGCYREVAQIGRALKQLRSAAPSDPEGDDGGGTPDVRALFGPPPS